MVLRLAALGLALTCAAPAYAEAPADPARDAQVDALVHRAWLEFQARRYAAAHAQLVRALKLAPDRVDVHYVLGETSFWLGRYTEAGVHFERVLQLEPTMTFAYHGLGQSELAAARTLARDDRARAPRLARAARAFRITLLLDPRSEGARLGLREIARLRGEQTYSLAWLQLAIGALVLLLAALAAYRLRAVLLAPARWRAGLRAYRWPLSLFVGSRALVLACFALAPALVAEAPSHPYAISHHPVPLLDAVMGRWDSNFFASVAFYGYDARPLDGSRAWSSIGQFPLLPVLHRALGASHIAALLLAHAALLLASLFLFALFRRWHGERVAIAACAVLLLHPGSLFGSVLYSEPLALLGLAGLVHCLERDAPLEAAGWGVFTGLARLNAIAIVPWLLYEALRRRGRERLQRAWPAFSPLLGSALFLLYLQLELGDGLRYFRELRDVRLAGGGTFVALAELRETLGHVADWSAPRFGPWFTLLVATACLGAYLLVALALLRARAFGPLLFLACGMLLALNSSLAAQPRYLWPLFVAFPVIARALDRPYLRYPLAALACAVLATSAVLFARWYYFT